MADNYTLFAVALEMPEAAAKYACDREGMLADMRGANPDEPQTHAEPMATDARAILAAAGEWYGTSAHFSTAGDCLLIEADESGDPEAVAAILQSTMKRFSLTTPFAIEWAHTCSALRPGEFGGGAVVITAAAQRWFATAEFVAQTVAALSAPPTPEEA